MADILRFRDEKLIRDKLPEIMRASGLRVFDRVLDDPEFLASLKTKLGEETAEAVAADSPEELLGELVDVMEVVLALTESQGFTMADLETARLAKREERGGFEARVYNAAVEAEATCPAVAYYLARPEQYPPI